MAKEGKKTGTETLEPTATENQPPATENQPSANKIPPHGSGVPTTRELEGMTVAELQKLCRSYNLCRTGVKEVLVTRLRARMRGRSDRYVPGGLNFCQICRAPAFEVSVDKLELPDGRTRFTRWMKCQGTKNTDGKLKHRHRFKLVEEVRPQD